MYIVLNVNVHVKYRDGVSIFYSDIVFVLLVPPKGFILTQIVFEIVFESFQSSL